MAALSSGFCNWRIDFTYAEIAAFVAGVTVALAFFAFFAFFPGLPHVIDWGAVLLSLLMGGLARWGCRAWLTKAARKKAGNR